MRRKINFGKLICMAAEVNWVDAAVVLAMRKCTPPSKEGLAAALGVSRIAIHHWQRRGSMRGARTETALRLAELSGVPIEKLAG